MNAFKTLALFAALSAAASVAFAQERVPDTQSAPFASIKSRAQVVAELEQARRNGAVRTYDGEHFMPAPMLDAARSRSDVRAGVGTSRGERRFDGNLAGDGRG